MKKQKRTKKEVSEKTNALLMALAIIVSPCNIHLIIYGTACFGVKPICEVDRQHLSLSLLEGIIRSLILSLYSIGLYDEGNKESIYVPWGEHKTINCLENGFELTVKMSNGRQRPINDAEPALCRLSC